MPIRIFKAKPRRRGTTVRVRPSRARDEALQEQMANGVQLSFQRGIRAMQADIDPDTLARAYMAGDYEKLMREIPVDKMPEYLGAAAGKIGNAVVAGAKEAKAIVSPHAFRYDLSNPRVAKYMASRSGALIEGVTDQFQQFVGGLVQRRFATGLATNDLAAAMLTPAGRSKTAGFVLKYGLGLDQRSADALATYSSSGKYTKQQAKQYESDLHVARAKRIARTEVAYAMNAGQHEVWDAAKEQGMIPEAAQKVWAVDGSPCDICIQMDGIAVDLADEFILPSGDSVRAPPAHPNCMCVMQLDTGSDDQGPENNE